ncbi:MAG: ribosome silencing factor [Thermoanaerobaculia bacterium]|nr:ribosome silencing factor [Thermoanaerobaculia bacterium]
MSQIPARDIEIPTRVRSAVAAIQDRKARDLLVLELAEISDFTDFFLLSTGSSERQVRAIADAVDERLREDGVRALHIEGYEHGQWVLMDYGDFLVHIFYEPTREYYQLERLWADAPNVTPEFE